MTFIPLSEISPLQTPTTPKKPTRLPPWFKVAIRPGPRYKTVKTLVDTHRLHTICEEARCPNLWECWNSGTATFLILGDICTRRCHYCSVKTGRPLVPDVAEPAQIAEAVRILGLGHAVITSVNRDDLPDGGASAFAETIIQIRVQRPDCTVEVLIPDFQGRRKDLETVMKTFPDIINHNIETVPRLFPRIRPQGKYGRSLNILSTARALGGRTKSGLMVGLGESYEEIRMVMRDLRQAGCQILTVGQYLRPTGNHAPVSRYYHPDEFEKLKKEALLMGFSHVESGPLVRSSYHAAAQVQGPAVANQ